MSWLKASVNSIYLKSVVYIPFCISQITVLLIYFPLGRCNAGDSRECSDSFSRPWTLHMFNINILWIAKQKTFCTAARQTLKAWLKSVSRIQPRQTLGWVIEVEKSSLTCREKMRQQKENFQERHSAHTKLVLNSRTLVLVLSWHSVTKYVRRRNPFFIWVQLLLWSWLRQTRPILYY